MVTNNVISGQAGGELDLKAQVGDLIRWRETSLSLGFEKSCSTSSSATSATN